MAPSPAWSGPTPLERHPYRGAMFERAEQKTWQIKAARECMAASMSRHSLISRAHSAEALLGVQRAKQVAQERTRQHRLDRDRLAKEIKEWRADELAQVKRDVRRGVIDRYAHTC